ALARLAAAALDVEAEPAWRVPAEPRLRQLREELPDRGEEPRVRGRVRARRASDRRLVDGDDLVAVLDAVDPVVGPRQHSRPVEVPGQGPVEDVVDQRALPRAADAGHASEGTERDPDVDVLEVVLPGAAHDQVLPVPRATPRRDFDPPIAP